MENLKVTFISTVLNEKKTIKSFLDSLLTQSKLPDEIIIVDGGSTDATASVISNFVLQSKICLRKQFLISKQRSKFKIITKKGNRSIGRNEAIKNSSCEIIACSDSGCILDKDWLKNITKPFSDKKTQVVAGYYKAKPQSLFEKCLVPYVLVMEDKVDPNKFLPSTRSIAFRKSAWEIAGGFDEKYSNNEDYVFARKLRKKGISITFTKNTIVYWLPRKNLSDAFKMFYRFAKGDAESGMFRVKPYLVIFRYILGLILLFLSVNYKSFELFSILFLIIIFYLIWSIFKNYRYVKDIRSIFIFPLIQLCADFAVMSGTIMGLIKK